MELSFCSSGLYSKNRVWDERCCETFASMALLLAQIFFYPVLHAAPYLFYSLNEIPSFLIRNCSETISKPKPIAQKAIVVRILSLNNYQSMGGYCRQHYVNEGRAEEAARGQ